MSQLIISEAYLKDKSVITNNTDFKYITPQIVLVQETKLRPLLGTNLYNLIITQSTPVTSLTPDNLVLVDTYILPFLQLYIMAKSILALKYKFTNTGVIVRDAGGSGTAIPQNEAKELADSFINDAEAYGQLMVDYIKANPTKYPTYFTNTGLGNVIPKSEAYDCGIYLDDGKGYISNEEIREIGSGLNGNKINKGKY